MLTRLATVAVNPMNYYAGNRFVSMWSGFFNWTRNKICLFIESCLMCEVELMVLPLLPHTLHIFHCAVLVSAIQYSDHWTKERAIAMKIDLLWPYFCLNCHYVVSLAVVTLTVMHLLLAQALHCIHNGHSFFACICVKMKMQI